MSLFNTLWELKTQPDITEDLTFAPENYNYNYCLNTCTYTKGENKDVYVGAWDVASITVSSSGYVLWNTTLSGQPVPAVVWVLTKGILEALIGQFSSFGFTVDYSDVSTCPAYVIVSEFDMIEKTARFSPISTMTTRFRDPEWDEVEDLSEWLESSCTQVDKVRFDNTAIEITDNAFLGDNTLTELNLPYCEEIGYQAFRECSSLIGVTAPNCQGVANNAFDSCTKLFEVNLPNCETVDSNVFYGCESLQHINLPKCTSVGYGAFQHNAITSISLPACTSFSSTPFWGCNDLKLIALGANAVPSWDSPSFPDSVTTIAVRSELESAYKTAWSTYADKIFGDTNQVNLTQFATADKFYNQARLTAGEGIVLSKNIISTEVTKDYVDRIRHEITWDGTYTEYTPKIDLTSLITGAALYKVAEVDPTVSYTAENLLGTTITLSGIISETVKITDAEYDIITFESKEEEEASGVILFPVVTSLDQELPVVVIATKPGTATLGSFSVTVPNTGIYLFNMGDRLYASSVVSKVFPGRLIPFDPEYISLYSHSIKINTAGIDIRCNITMSSATPFEDIDSFAEYITDKYLTGKGIPATGRYIDEGTARVIMGLVNNDSALAFEYIGAPNIVTFNIPGTPTIEDTIVKI